MSMRTVHRAALLISLSASTTAAEVQAEQVEVPVVQPLAPTVVARHDARVDATRARPPAWVVGDVPDTVWILVEASVAEPDEERAKATLRRAEALARASVVGHETNVGRRFALAAVLGMRSEIEGGRTKVGVASELYDELGAVLELEPGHTRAHYMMGRLHAGVRRMNGVTRWLATNVLGGDRLKEASWAKAEEHLVYAEGQAPEVPDHHLQLARLYADTDRPGLALAEARHVLAMEPASPLEWAARARAVELVEELEEAR